MILNGFLDGSGTQAACANLNTLDGARFAVDAAELLQIGKPSPLRFIVGVADVIADDRFFTAYRTNSGHEKSLHQKNGVVGISNRERLQAFFESFVKSSDAAHYLRTF